MYSITQTIGGYRVTTPFKTIDKLHPHGHKGLDLAIPSGTELHSITGGKVLFSGWDDKLGNYVKVHSYDGSDIIYGHLKDCSVDTGDFIVQGQLLGHIGSTGRSTGAHLHLQISKDGQLVDPTSYAQKLGGINNDDHQSILDHYYNISNFIKDSHDQGIWYAFTGKHFTESLIQFGKDMLNMMVQCSDTLVIVAMILGLGAIAGSSFCKKWLWYTSILYLILKCLGVYSL